MSLLNERDAGFFGAGVRESTVGSGGDAGLFPVHIGTHSLGTGAVKGVIEYRMLNIEC